MLVRGGKLDPTYQITVPEDLNEADRRAGIVELLRHPGPRLRRTVSHIRRDIDGRDVERFGSGHEEP